MEAKWSKAQDIDIPGVYLVSHYPRETHWLTATYTIVVRYVGGRGLCFGDEKHPQALQCLGMEEAKLYGPIPEPCPELTECRKAFEKVEAAQEAYDAYEGWRVLDKAEPETTP